MNEGQENDLDSVLEPSRGEALSEPGTAEKRVRKKRRRAIAPPCARTCKQYMRKRLARALPRIANGLIKGAREGNLGDLKMLVQMCFLDDKEPPKPAGPRRGKTLEELLMDDWRKEPTDGKSRS
jgi:hypothetical protein